MKKSLFKGKSTRTKIFTAISIVAICLILVMNILLAGVCQRNLVFIDLTPEEFYTLSDTMQTYCHSLLDPDENGNTKKIEITFCTDPDYLVDSAYMRTTYFMALALQKEFDNVTVKTVNVALDPTAVSMYKTTSRDSIDVTDIIVSYGEKYRVANAVNFWTKDMASYNGEYRLASIMASLTAVEQPVAYFVTGHGETYYDPDDPENPTNADASALADLLMDRGLKIDTIDLSEIDEVPDDCVLLVVNDPQEDFKVDTDRLNEFGYVSETEKVDRYLLRNSGAIMLAKDYRISLPNLEDLALEWGVAFGNAPVYDEENTLFASDDEASVFTGVYDTDEESYGYAYYGSYSTLVSSPRMVFSDTGYVYCGIDGGDNMYEMGNKQGMRNYAEFIGTSDSAYYKVDGAIDIGRLALAAVGVRFNLNYYTGERESTSYFFCSNSKDFFSNEILTNGSYANYDIMSSVITDITRTDRYADTDLGGFSLNSANSGGKRTQSTALTEESQLDSYGKISQKGFTVKRRNVYTMLVMIPAAATLALGIFVFIKRKFL